MHRARTVNMLPLWHPLAQLPRRIPAEERVKPWRRIAARRNMPENGQSVSSKAKVGDQSYLDCRLSTKYLGSPLSEMAMRFLRESVFESIISELLALKLPNLWKQDSEVQAYWPLQAAHVWGWRVCCLPPAYHPQVVWRTCLLGFIRGTHA